MSDKEKYDGSAEDIKGKAVGGFFWTLAERFAAQGVSFIVSIILARLLLPDDYGIVAIVSIFTSIANVLVKSGLGSALIQKSDADSTDFSTVFYYNLVFSLFIYLLLFFGAPMIAEFYHIPLLIPVLRVNLLNLILYGLNNVQQAYVSKKLAFKQFFWSTIVGTIMSAVVGILMAYNGFGVWSLVTQQLLNSAIDTIILNITIGWNPGFVFSLSRLRDLLGFGWKLLLSDLLSSVYSNIQGFVIGKKYSAEQLAYYNKGNTFPQILVRNLDNSIQSVIYPVLSKAQNDKKRFIRYMYRGSTLSFFFICPMMIGMIVVAQPLVSMLLTEKWLSTVPYLQLYCITYLLRPIEATNLQAMYALGRSDITLKLELIKKIYGIGSLIIAITVFNSPVAICFSLVICTILNTLLNMSFVSKLIGYKVFDQIKSFGVTFALSLSMGVVCFFVGRMIVNMNTILRLIIPILTGMGYYTIGSALLKNEPFMYAVNMLQEKMKNRIKR